MTIQKAYFLSEVGESSAFLPSYGIRFHVKTETGAAFLKMCLHQGETLHLPPLTGKNKTKDNTECVLEQRKPHGLIFGVGD